MGHNDIINAFKRAEPHVQICCRGGKDGFIHIHGPRFPPKEAARRCSNHYVVIEKGTAAVVFPEELCEPLRGRERPAKNKSEHELGSSIHTSTGRFRFGITRGDILERGLDEFVKQVISCCKKLGIW